MSMTKTSIQDISTTFLSHYSQKSMMLGRKLMLYKLIIVRLSYDDSLSGGVIQI